MMRPHERFTSQLVQRAGQPLRQATAVHEKQRRPMGSNQLEQPGVNGGPDRWRAAGCRTAWNFVDLPRASASESRGDARHVLDGDVDPQCQLLLLGRVDNGDRPELDLFLFGNGKFLMDFDFCVGRLLLRLRPSRFRYGSLQGAAQEPRDLFERALRRGQSNPLEGPAEAGPHIWRT